MAEYLTPNLCPHWINNAPQNSCGGCQAPFDHLQKHFDQAVLTFSTNFTAHFNTTPSIQILNPWPLPGRDRMDFQLSFGKVGFFNPLSHQLIPINDCLLLSPSLSWLFKKFIALNLPQELDKISIRLRVGPNMQAGLWIDTSHHNTMAIFNHHQDWLKQLLQLGYVEWGQQRKNLFFDHQDAPKLAKKNLTLPHLFATQIKDSSFPLQLHVGDFTQPSIILNKMMIQTIEHWLSPHSKLSHLIEFGAGIGNFTFALSPYFKSITAYELDPYQSLSFATNLKSLKQDLPQIDCNIQLITTDARQSKNISDLQAIHSDDHWIFLNPSRSGVGNFIKELPISIQGGLIYLSCYPESFIADMKQLSHLFICTEIVIVNQFPLSSHIEILSLWKPKSALSS